jgi:hypothetical protein
MAGGMHISIFGDGTFSAPHQTGFTTPDTKLGYGGGAQIEFGLGPMVGLEIGAVYLGRKFQVSGSAVQTTTNYAQIPVQLRYWVGRYFSLGAGGYFAQAIGDVKFSDGSSASYASLNEKTSDYGLIGSVGLNAPLSPTASLFAEGRFAYGLDDQNTPAQANPARWQDIQVLVGLRFGTGGSRY